MNTIKMTESNTTKQYETPNATSGRSTPGGMRRLRSVVIALLSVGALSAAGGVAFAQGPAEHVGPYVANTSVVAEWAQSNGLYGLSPASIASTPVLSTAEVGPSVADWARANGLSGLSPASVGPTR